MERFDFDKLSDEDRKCDIEMDVVRLVSVKKPILQEKLPDCGEDRKKYVYPEELELNGWIVLADTNGGKNKIRLFRKCNIIDSDRFKRGEPWIRVREVKKWIKKVDGMKKMGGFNSNGWTKIGLNKKIYRAVAKDKIMVLFVKKRIFSLR